MNSFSRRVFLLLFLLLLGVGGCTWRRAKSTLPVPTPTPAPVVLPRFTPHVTSAVPTIAPIISSPTPGAPASPPPPTPVSPSTPTPTPRIHIVQPYETLYDIAVQYQVPLKDLARVNRITDPTRIKPGDALIIP